MLPCCVFILDILFESGSIPKCRGSGPGLVEREGNGRYGNRIVSVSEGLGVFWEAGSSMNVINDGENRGRQY